MGPKKKVNDKKKRTGDVMMFCEKQNNYLKRKKMNESRKKKDCLKYLMKKAVQQLSSKERKELKQLQGEMKKK